MFAGREMSSAPADILWRGDAAIKAGVARGKNVGLQELQNGLLVRAGAVLVHHVAGEFEVAAGGEKLHQLRHQKDVGIVGPLDDGFHAPCDQRCGPVFFDVGIRGPPARFRNLRAQGRDEGLFEHLVKIMRALVHGAVGVAVVRRAHVVPVLFEGVEGLVGAGQHPDVVVALQHLLIFEDGE